MMNRYFLLALLGLFSGAEADSFNASIYVNLKAPDGTVYETQTRRVLAPGVVEDLKGGGWGVTIAFEEGLEDSYRVIATVLRQTEFQGRRGWIEYTGTESDGQLDAPLEVNYTEGDLHLEMALFVSSL